MDRLRIVRRQSRDFGTFGNATFKTGVWSSLELPWRDNLPDRSCVQAGLFVARWRFSSKFGCDLYELEGVPGRSAVEIHIANFAGDVDLGYQSDLEGCICLGRSEGDLLNHMDILQECVRESGPAFRQFMSLADEAPRIGVEIVWANGADPS